MNKCVQRGKKIKALLKSTRGLEAPLVPGTEPNGLRVENGGAGVYTRGRLTASGTGDPHAEHRALSVGQRCQRNDASANPPPPVRWRANGHRGSDRGCESGQRLRRERAAGGFTAARNCKGSGLARLKNQSLRPVVCVCVCLLTF